MKIKEPFLCPNAIWFLVLGSLRRKIMAKEKTKKRVSIRETLKLIFSVTTKGEKARLIVLFLASLLTGLTYTIPTLMLSVIVNLLSGVDAVVYGIVIPATFSIIAVIIAGFMLGVLREFLMTFITNRAMLISCRIQCRLKETAYEWALAPRKNMDLTLTSGDVAYRINESTHAINDLFEYVFNYILPSLFAAAVCFIYLVVIEIYALPILAVGLILTFIICAWRNKNEKVITVKSEKIKGQISNNMMNVLHSLFVINLFKAERHEKKILEDQNNEYYKVEKKERQIRWIYWTLLGVLHFAAIYAIIYIMTLRASAGGFNLGNIVLVTNYTFQVFDPISSMGWLFTEIVNSSIKIGRVKELKPTKEKLIDTSLDKPLKQKIKKIEMRNVTVKNSEKSIISNINMVFERGELTVVKGRSGKGKTTAIRALCGIAERESGDIIINDNIFVHTMQSYLDRISVTMQSSYIFNRNVIDNIYYPETKKHVSDFEMFNNLNMNELIVKRYDPESEQNLENQLSGGEKKRICVTRGIVKDAEVYIFDEPTNELDTDNTRKVVDILNKLKQKAIVIVVTHDARISDVADKIIEM